MEQDKIINAIEIGEINTGNVSFNKVKRIATSPTPPDVHSELNYGHAILYTQDQLNKYLYAYGSMISRQWVPMFNRLEPASNDIEIIDYACGQGLASMLFFDKHKNMRLFASSLTLIEPSKIALNRAKNILQCYVPKTKIKTVNKKLDNISENDIQTNNNTTKIHLFSNIVDMNVFDITPLIDKIIFTKGRNYFIAMSSDRNSFGGTERLDAFYKYFKEKINLYRVIKIKTDSFIMENPSAHPQAKNFNIRFAYIEIEV